MTKTNPTPKRQPRKKKLTGRGGPGRGQGNKTWAERVYGVKARQTKRILYMTDDLYAVYADAGGLHPKTGKPLGASVGARNVARAMLRFPDEAKVMLETIGRSGELPDSK